MQQLSANDAMFLYMENATNYGHVGALAILDCPEYPSVRTPEEEEGHLEHFLQMVPFSRKKLATVPLGLGHPFWVDDADFDFEYHNREIAVPAPGTPQQVEKIVSRIAARHLDRSRPLYENYVLTGLDAGTHVGTYMKTHHAAADGAAMVALALATVQLTPDIVTNPMPETKWEPEPTPSQAELLGAALRDATTRPGKFLSFNRRLFREIREQLGDSELRARLPELVADAAPSNAPETRFQAAAGPHRSWSFGSTPLEEVKAIKKAAGCTVNDVVLAICAQMLRDWMLDHNELPDESLIAMVPVNLRQGEASAEQLENQVGSIAGKLHTAIADPVERLGKISESMTASKEMQRALPAELQMDAMGLVPAWAMAQAARLVTGTQQNNAIRPFNLTISNVPGPQFPTYTDGAMTLASYPYSTIATGVGLNITVSSYNGNLDWGIVSCRDMCPDLWPMWDGIQKAQKGLLAAVT